MLLAAALVASMHALPALSINAMWLKFASGICGSQQVVVPPQSIQHHEPEQTAPNCISDHDNALSQCPDKSFITDSFMRDWTKEMNKWPRKLLESTDSTVDYTKNITLVYQNLYR